MAEHLLLTTSYLALGRSPGFTTQFGDATKMFGSSLCVWAHFTLNLAATYFTWRAVRAIHQKGLLIARWPAHIEVSRLSIRSV